MAREDGIIGAGPGCKLNSTESDEAAAGATTRHSGFFVCQGL